MRPLFAVLTTSIAIVSAAAEQNIPAPERDIRQCIEKEFDITKLKSIILEYERQVMEEGRMEKRTVLFVKEEGKFYLRIFFPEWGKYDYTTKPPAERGNTFPVTIYLWGMRETAVEGYSDPAAWWFITPAGQSDGWFYFDETYHDLDSFLAMFSPAKYSWSRDALLVGRQDTTNGVIYFFTNPSRDYQGEYTVSDHDGGGVAPIHSKGKHASGLAKDTTWSGWMNYNGIWVPRSSVQWCVVEKSDGETTRLIEKTITYNLIRVESVNEPIHPRWFMPQFPARHITIEDRTVSPPRVMDNIDLDGNPYPAPEGSHPESWEALEEEEPGGLDEQAE